MSYHCPVCKKISNKSALDLARHMIGRGDKVHRDWINSKGFKYSELLALQFSSFGGEGFKSLAEVLEKEAKVKD
ncbi:MAG: hypothetical protein HQ588_03020 [Deltaproteobacteria bacterium]|nr:hypothetical protein [Deltaproteobacteria bacterium]